jgi:hypothetical protein
MYSFSAFIGQQKKNDKIAPEGGGRREQKREGRLFL